MRGYQRAFAEFPGIQVLGSGIGNYQQPDARRVMEKFLTEHKEIDAVLSANDSMALGVLEALKAANRTAIVIGINGILPAVKQIETGGMLATVDFNMFKIGCTATRAAVRHLKQEPLPEKMMLPAEVIDKTNYKAWLVPVDQRTCPEWARWRAEAIHCRECRQTRGRESRFQTCRCRERGYIGSMAVSSPDLKAFLLATPFFGGLSDASLDLLISMLAERSFDAGATIFAEGEPGRSMFIVHTGHLVVSKLGESGRSSGCRISSPAISSAK